MNDSNRCFGYFNSLYFIIKNDLCTTKMKISCTNKRKFNIYYLTFPFTN